MPKPELEAASSDFRSLTSVKSGSDQKILKSAKLRMASSRPKSVVELRFAVDPKLPFVES
jgi:hypothetical protein